MTTSVYVRFWFAVLFLASVGSGSSSSNAKPPVPVEQQVFFAPFTPLPRNGGPLVEVRFQNGVTGTFLVDTGAVDCIMTDAMADRLGLKQTFQFRMMSADQSFYYLARFATVPAMHVNGFGAANIEFDIVPSRSLSIGSANTRFDGMIGGALLQHLALFIDSRNHKLAFIVPGNLTAADRQSLGLSLSETIPLKKYTHWKPYLSTTRFEMPQYTAKIGLTSAGHSVDDELIVDTGTSGSTISPAAAEKLHLAPSRHENIWTEATGSVPMGISRVERFSLGSLQLSDRSVLFPESVKNDTLETGGDVPALLGEDVLGHCTVLMDFPGRALYLKPSLAPLIPSGEAPVEKDRLRAAVSMPSLELARSALRWSDEYSDDYVAAIGVLQDLADRSDGLVAGRLYRRIGESYRLLRDGLRGDTAFFHAVTMDRVYLAAHREEPAAREELATALSEAGGNESEAQALARQCVATVPDTADAEITLGNVLLNSAVASIKGDSSGIGLSPLPPLAVYAPIAELAQELAAKRPGKTQAKNAEKFREEAGKCFDRAVTLAPAASASYAARANFRLKAGVCVDAALGVWRGHDTDWRKMIYSDALLADHRKTVELAPDNVEAQRSLAYLEIEWPNVHPEHYKLPKNVVVNGKSPFDIAPVAAQAAAQACITRLEALSAGGDHAASASAAAALAGIYENMRSDSARAKENLRRALSLDPKQNLAAHQLIWQLEKEKKWDDALELVGQRVRGTEPTLQMRLKYVDLMASYRPNTDAEPESSAVEKQFPESVTAHLGHAALLLRRPDVSPAETTETLKLVRGCLDLAEMGLAAAEKGLRPERDSDPESALDSGRLTCRAQRTELSNLRAAYLALTGAPGDARELLLKTLDRDPTDTDGREMLSAF